MTRFKRILKKTAVTLIALALVLFVTNSLLNYYWGRQIESRLAAIKAKGEPVSLADLRNQSVPEQDNAAPIYKRAFKVMFEPATARDMEALDRVLYPQSKTPSIADWDKAKSALARCDRVFALIEEAQSKPVCQFSAYPIQMGQSRESIRRYIALCQEHFQQQAGMRNAARLLNAKAVFSARQGRTQDVVRYIQSALKLNDAIGANDSLIDCLVNVAYTTISLAGTRQALSYCQPNESELRQLNSAFSRFNALELYRHAIEWERIHFILQTDEFRTAGARLPLSNGDTLAYIDFLSRHLDCTRMNYSVALSKGLVGPNATNNLPFYAILTKILAPVQARAADVSYKCEAEIACGRIFLALRAYKLRFGQYPQTLGDLRSGIKWEVPVDPFNGKDLVYKRDRGGFILYSVGFDLKDNGGTALQLRDKAEQCGDIVFHPAGIEL